MKDETYLYEYLNDIDFLQELDSQHLRTTYAKIILLSFDEKPLKEIQGQITSGSMSVNGSSAVRRTINLTMLASLENSNIMNIDNEIAINKKVKIFIGLKNTLNKYTNHDIIWFPLGVYILSSANVSRNTNGWSISLSGKDKMCQLDGTCGGVLPATTIFHDKQIQNDDGTITTLYPTIYQIIFEAVNHWGGEIAENIVISDIDEEIKLLLRYIGEDPIYFDSNYTQISFTPITGDNVIIKRTNDDVGYEMVPFTYPGELVLKAGDTVVTLLNKIKELLGNYEFFYDVWGNFVFQEIKNYLNKPSHLKELVESDYTRSYNNRKYLYDLTSFDTTTAITISPKYDNIKNDFYVWGQRTTGKIKTDICYHLVVDKKPLLKLAATKMWIYEAKTETDVKPLIYRFGDQAPTDVDLSQWTLIKEVPKSDEWREELYRTSLVAQSVGSVSNTYYGADEWDMQGQIMMNNYYDSELLAHWRELYDPCNEDWENGWNPDVANHPEKLNYWLDFIDSSAEIGKYSVNQIGRRTKVINDTNIKSIYNKEVPDIVFVNSSESNLIAQYAGIGQKYFLLRPDYCSLFVTSSTGASCFDRIRELLYQNLSYNTTISLSCLPKYYMEPNNIIHVEDIKTGINGNYQITQFSLPLTYNGLMNITATEVLQRV